MSDYIINDEWIHSFMVSIEELIGESIEYEGYQNPVPPLREIVRCRDCKYAEIDQSDHEYREPLWCDFHRMDVKPGNFCAWGKRKGEDE